MANATIESIFFDALERWSQGSSGRARSAIIIEQHEFNLVVSDILMPKLNGYALVARIRMKWPKMPIVLTSAYPSPWATKTLNDSVEFIPKSIDATALIATVQRLNAVCLGQHQVRRN
jgi:DNA-binding NtrC family response regulator